MIFGLALNLHDDVPHAVRNFTQWLILAGTVLVAVLLGGPLVRTTLSELRKGRLTIEALFLLTMAGALAASLQAHLTGRGKIYFEVVSVLLVVYTLGRLIGARTRAAALSRSRAWGEQLCTCRLVDAAGHTRTAPVVDVMPGDEVEVHPGELIAVDGVIRQGVGFVSESVVSGEPFVVVRRPGDRVLAGSVTFDATFRITANAKGTERQVDRLLAAVEEARDKPLALQSRADRLGRWVLPLVVFTALGTFGYWTFLTDVGWETALFNAMSVLLVACPCVIGLATPVVIWSALGRLAERGVIVRSGDAIERLAGVDRVMFDKTGTLTEDRFALVDIETTATGIERTKLLGWLSLVQAQSHHPVAKPFAELPRPYAPGEEPRVLSLVAVPGCGVVAELVEADGTRHEIRIGTPEWLRFDRVPQAPGREGGKTVHVVLDGELAAVATVAERLRASAPEALAHFAQLGLPVEVLTGDASGRAEALGLPPTRAELLPDDKRAVIEAVKTGGAKPLFVGDGINDAAALAAAHIGVALSSGTDLAVSAAAVTLYHDDLRALPWAVELSRATVRAVRRNLFRALAYNLVGMTLAACGVLHPVVAAILMVVSSLTLIFSSTRVGCAKEPNPPSPFPKRERGGAESDEPIGSGVFETSPARSPSQFSPSAPPPSLRGKGDGGLGSALVHALAFALQGFAFLLLLASLREPLSAVLLVVAFALVGAVLAVAWRRLPVPHWLDMCFGMLTLGNLGMLLGWWIDNGFTALHDHGCCACVEAMRDGVMKPWMWVGMLALANGAMRWFGRSPAPRGCHALAMWTGGNAGMVVGMLAGGWSAAQFATTSVTSAVAVSFAGMTVGMLAGMLAGTWCAERLFTGLRAVGLVPKWLRVTTPRTS
jgi:heavy metal translocating P-type ATPase